MKTAARQLGEIETYNIRNEGDVNNTNKLHCNAQAKHVIFVAWGNKLCYVVCCV